MFNLSMQGARSPSRNDSICSPTRMRKQDSCRSSRSLSKFAGHGYEEDNRHQQPALVVISVLPRLKGKVHLLVPIGNDHRCPNPSLATTATTKNFLILENVTDISIGSASEMQRYIKENNSQIIYPNDCLNMQY